MSGSGTDGPVGKRKTLAFRRFNPDTDLFKAGVATVLGPSQSGKSILMRDILYHRRHDFDYGLSFSCSERYNHAYAAFMPPIFTYDEFNLDVLSSFLNHCGFMREKYDKKIKKHPELADTLKRPAFFVVLDDITHDNKWERSKVVTELFTMGRQCNIFCLIGLHGPMCLNPLMRENLIATFILNFPSETTREKIFKHYGSGVDNKKTFNKMHDAFTRDHSALVLVNNGKPEMNECVFHYKANKNLPKFRMCDDRWWEISDKFYEKEYSLKKFEEKSRKLLSKKKQEKIEDKLNKRYLELA